MDNVFQRIKKGWNVFRNKNPVEEEFKSSPTVYSYGLQPSKIRVSNGKERTIVNAIYNKIAIDVAAFEFKHCETDQNGKFKSVVKSGFNQCLNLSANLDQTSKMFFVDMVTSALQEGVVAVIPEDYDKSEKGEITDVYSCRIGKVVAWGKDTVKVNLWNPETCRFVDMTFPKRLTAIIENPFSDVMNAPNSTMQRLIRKLAILDAIDEQSGSGRLDVVVQLPYSVRNDLHKKEAEERRKDLENQLASGNKFGVAYIDAAEHLTQLNRPVENNLMAQIQYLTSMLYSQLGMTEEIMNGTANEEAMTNYFNRTIGPIADVIDLELTRKFISEDDRDNGRRILHNRNPFMLMSASKFADASDKYSRNAIMTPNEIRGFLGLEPSDQPGANELRNRNQYRDDEQAPNVTGENAAPEAPVDTSQNG